MLHASTYTHLREDATMAILASNRNLVIECSNGYAVSIAYGEGSYSSNRDGKAPILETGSIECTTVEIAILDLAKKGDDHYVKLSSGPEATGVHGWIPADEVARVIGAVVEGDLKKAKQILYPSVPRSVRASNPSRLVSIARG